MAMARIVGADPSQQGLLQGLFTRIIYSMVKRKVGRVVLPVKIAAHHAKLLWGYGQMEQSLFSSKLVDAGLKNLSQLRVATLVGCPFLIDIGSAVSRTSGVSVVKMEALPNYRNIELFSEVEKLELVYVYEIVVNPVVVPAA